MPAPVRFDGEFSTAIHSFSTRYAQPYPPGQTSAFDGVRLDRNERCLPSSSLLIARPSCDDDEVARLRVPPHSIEAEQSVLGGLLLDNLAWDRAGDLLSDSDFYGTSIGSSMRPSDRSSTRRGRPT